MTQVTVTIEVDGDYADPDHITGLTEEGFEALSDAINAVGTIVKGPSLG
jgi:hypothetical protein